MGTALESIARRLRGWAAETVTVPDGDLLARFVAAGDEPAFAELVGRHGPRVFGVCYRVLRDRHDAEDAFQATFLVLARRAKVVREFQSVGAFLIGVAYRIASRLRRQRTRRAHVPLPDVGTESPDDVTWRDVQRVLDEELSALPERLRDPLVLCYLEGLTRDEAARALGLKLSTLRGRLEDGRERLHTRLARRGVELSAVLLALSTANRSLAISDTLRAAAVGAGIERAPHTIQTLAGSITVAPWVGKIKWVVGAVLVGALGLGALALVNDDPDRTTPKEAPAVPVLAPNAPAENDPLAALKELADGADRIWVVKSPVNGKPPEPEEVLKGSTPPAKGYGFTFDVEGLKDLPASEPDKKWIVFLRSLEEVDHKPIISPLPRKGWYIPFDPAAVAALKAHVPPMQWGEARNGLKLGLRVRPDLDETTVEVALQNVGKDALTFEQFRGTYFDNWEPLRFTLKTPDGKQWTLYRYTLTPKDSDAPRHRTLQPGETYIHAIRITRWQVAREAMDPPPPKNPFEAPGKYELSVTFAEENAGTKPPPGWWFGTINSGTVTISDPVGELDPTIRALALKADRIWVVPSPTKEAPVPAPEFVLKGSRLAPGKSVQDLERLPADDPTKKWIVFLLSTEEGTRTPDIRVWQWTRWRWPYDPRIARQIQAALLPTEWGNTDDGLRMGLRLRETQVVSGHSVVVEVVIQNVGTRERTLSQHRYNIYDYWPATTFTVRGPNGTSWELIKPVTYLKEFDLPLSRTLKPGESYIHAMRLNLWPDKSKLNDTEVNRFTIPGEYSIEVTYSQSKDLPGNWVGKLTSPTVKLTVTKPPKEDAPPGEAPGTNRPNLKFDDVRLLEKTGQPAQLFVVLTDAKADLERSRALVVQYAGAALHEAEKTSKQMPTVVFLIRQTPDSEVGSYAEFSAEQLKAIGAAAPDEARRLVSVHAWNAFGKLPPASK
jgi:RNA polymerase sigma factor (sigma-70 family)